MFSVEVFHTNSNALELRLEEHTGINGFFIYHSLRDRNQMQNVATHLLKMLVCPFREFDHAPVVSVNWNLVMLGLAWHCVDSRLFEHHFTELICDL